MSVLSELGTLVAEHFDAGTVHFDAVGNSLDCVFAFCL